LAGSVLNAVRAQAATDEPGAPRSAGPLQSAGAMTFGPGNVLFVGDIAGSAVHAFALRDEDLSRRAVWSWVTSTTSKVSTWSAAST
jgi:hypothetical protein